MYLLWFGDGDGAPKGDGARTIAGSAAGPAASDQAFISRHIRLQSGSSCRASSAFCRLLQQRSSEQQLFLKTVCPESHVLPDGGEGGRGA